LDSGIRPALVLSAAHPDLGKKVFVAGFRPGWQSFKAMV
jgi:hypothetical protein